MAGDIEDMGEEEIRARMELEKVGINRWYGLIFSLLIGVIIFALYNINDPVLKYGGFFVWFVIAIIVIWRQIKPSEKRFLDLAIELDRRKIRDEKENNNG